jgi:hypothetical protein
MRLEIINWKKFIPGEKLEAKLNPISKLIVEKLGAGLDVFFEKSQGEKTEQIMDALSQLGRERGCYSMSSRISGTVDKQGYNKERFKKAEWLYDLHWYKENKPYGMTDLPLVVECEWEWIRDEEREKKKKLGDEKPDNFGAIKWDFQKLLVANANLRLMVFKQRIKASNDELDKYFSETIQDYNHLSPDSKFLFIKFDESIASDKRGLYYKQIVAK